MNLNETALRYGVTQYKIKSWIVEKMPVIQIAKGKGKPYIFDESDCDEWVADKKIDEAAKALIKAQEEDIASELDADIKKAKLEKLGKDMEFIDLKMAITAGALTPIDEVGKVFEDMLVVLRTNLRNLPSKLAARVEKLSTAAEIKKELQAAIDDVLIDLSVPRQYE